MEGRVNYEPYSYHAGNGEYLPMAVDVKRLTAAVESNEQTILFPILYYNGYQAGDLDTREKLATETGDNGRVVVMVPAGYSGTFWLRYCKPLLWRLAEAVSAFTMTVINFFLCRSSCKAICYESQEKFSLGIEKNFFL